MKRKQDIQTRASGNRAKQTKPFTIKMQKKLVVLFLFVLLAFAGLSARLIWINREDGERYTKQVLSQQSYDSITLPYKRGDIVDANGTKLAVSEKVYNLIIDAKVMLDKEAYLEPTMEALSTCFALDMGVIRAHVADNPTSSWYVAARKLSYEEVAPFKAMQAENSSIRGVWFEEEYKRIYPYGTLACDVIGFTVPDNIGTFGLEEYYNDVLNGNTGREYGYLNDDANLERTVKPAEDGYTIHSTLDVYIQGVVEKYFRKFNEDHANTVREGLGAQNLGCIIMDVDSGEILAMAGYPAFDLNNPRDLSVSGLYSEEAIAALEAEGTKMDALNELWRNYCIFNTYEPGSTAKPFTVAAALESGAITGDEEYFCNGYLEVGGHKIRCHSFSYGGEGVVSVQNSIAWSCNVALMKVAEAMGKETFTTFQQAFNFGLKTNIDLAGEARTKGLLFPVETMGSADLATNSFGQNFNVTMIQMITGYCALINGGYYYEPHIVNKITNSAGATVETIEPRVLKQVISESTSEKIRSYTRAVVMEEGGDHRTGKSARPAGYAIGGKTGTAQTLPRGNGEYVLSFMGHAPADNPQIAIYVVVDRPNSVKADDTRLATTLVRDILTEILPYLNIFMTEPLSDAEVAELQERQLAITSAYSRGEQVQEEQAPAEPVPETPAVEPAWKSYATDPATGNLVEPETGLQLDPTTGEYITGGYDFLSGEEGTPPVNEGGQVEGAE